MDLALKRRFIDLWTQYCPGAELPLALYYTEEVPRAPLAPSPQGFRCLICDLADVRHGATRCFDAETLGCSGARRYLGFDQRLRPHFAHFLSCGIPGEVEGERYKQSPDLVDQYLDTQPPFQAPGQYIVFKRWDHLDPQDDPAVIIFFALPDVLSGLFTLTNFDEIDPQAVITPFGSGCSSIVYHPYRELESPHPRAILGLFDVSARPCVPARALSFSVPWPKFHRMIDNMEESFLITESWHKIRSRMHEVGTPLSDLHPPVPRP